MGRPLNELSLWVPRLTKEFVACPHCSTQHIDQGPYTEKPHTRHLCLKADGGCGRFFFTKKANIGVAVAE